MSLISSVFLTAVATFCGFLIFLLKTKGFEHVIIHYRWIFVCLFLLPASAVYDVVFYIRNRIIFHLQSAPKQHNVRVQEIQGQVSTAVSSTEPRRSNTLPIQVRRWNKEGRKKPMCTARPGWLAMSFRTPLYKKSMNAVRIDLMDVLEVDEKQQVVRVEPLVSMGQLTATLNPLGFTLPVIPEMDDLTIGGLIMGVGIETSSHIYGLFQETVEAMEVVLQDGSLVRCSRSENPDLFFALPWSHGTLGFLVKAEIRIIPASKFVRLEYFPAYSASEMARLFTTKSLEREKNHFVEGLVFSRDTGVVMTGTFTNDPGTDEVNSIGHYWKPWFYKHVQEFLKTERKKVECIPLRQYYHRHTKSIFWNLENIIPFGNHPVFRYLFGWMVPPKVSFLKLTQGDTIRRLYEERQMIQDMLVPLKDLDASLTFFDEEVNLYPLWLCPFWLPSHQGLARIKDENSEGEMYVDIGAYGEPKTPKFHFRTTTRTVEAFVRAHKGFQMLYADSYMTRDEFREMFDHTLYDRMRHELNCDGAFPDIYEKTSRAARF